MKSVFLNIGFAIVVGVILGLFSRFVVEIDPMVSAIAAGSLVAGTSYATAKAKK
jgi:Na+-translocating ferredoxin:NAD+ oxidoreductase RNF subunit RnfB